MSAKKSYNRFFIIFQEEDKGYGVAIDKQPTGYTKIENRNGICKITLYVQNLSTEKGPYTCTLIDASKDPGTLASLGEIRLDESGRGETFWEYKEEDIAGTGMPVDKFNVAAVIVDGMSAATPLVGYSGKEKLEWKTKLMRLLRGPEEEQKEEEQKAEETEVEVEVEEARKFKEYEESIKEELKEVQEEQEEQLRKKEAKAEEKASHHDKDVKAEAKHDEVKEQGHGKTEEAAKLELKSEELKAPAVNQEVKAEAGPQMEASYKAPLNEIREEKPANKPIDTGYMMMDNMSTAKPPENDYMAREDTHAACFHQVLKGFREVPNLTDAIPHCRWWRIPCEGDVPESNSENFEYYCAVHHLRMSYPYINYMRYLDNSGYSYFGVKYDQDGEVKYLVYGIEGRNIPSDQPYMGMTGFSKWVRCNDTSKGMWIMYYNPFKGCIMIPKDNK